MDIVETSKASIKDRGLKVALPEGEDERILRAAQRLSEARLAQPVIMGKPARCRRAPRRWVCGSKVARCATRKRRRARHLCRAHRRGPREDDGGHGRAHAASAPLLCRRNGGSRRRRRHGGRSGEPDAARDRGRPDHHRPGARYRHAVELLPDARAGRRRRQQGLHLCRLRHQRRARCPRARRYRHRLGGKRQEPHRRRAARGAVVVLHPRQRQPPARRQGARRVGDGEKVTDPISPSTASCRATRRSRPSSPPRRCRPPAPWQAAPTCSSSRTSTPATSPTSWCSTWAAPPPSAPSCRASPSRSRICREARASMISLLPLRWRWRARCAESKKRRLETETAPWPPLYSRRVSQPGRARRTPALPPCRGQRRGPSAPDSAAPRYGPRAWPPQRGGSWPAGSAACRPFSTGESRA